MAAPLRALALIALTSLLTRPALAEVWEADSGQESVGVGRPARVEGAAGVATPSGASEIPFTGTLAGVETLARSGDWTRSTTTIVTWGGAITQAGFAHGLASPTGTAIATDGGLRMRTPTPVAISSAGLPPSEAPVLGYPRLEFLPEPGLFALLAFGAVGLALLVRARARR